MNTPPLRLLVTGASGFIGSRLALHLHRLGIDCVFTGRDASEIERVHLRELAACGIPVRLGDLREPAFVSKLLAGRNTVIHLAAAQHESHMNDEYFRSVNVGATRVLLDASCAAGVHRFVYGSTIGIYGSSEHGALNEESRPQPLNIYARTKLAAEATVREYASHLEITTVRIAETYGPGDLRLLKLFRAIDRGRFVMIGRGHNHHQPIFVGDLIRGLLAAATEPRASGETVLLSGNEPMTTQQMIAHIATALSRPAPRLQVPLWPVLTLAVAVNAVLRPLGIRSPLHARSLDFFRKSFVFSTSKAQELLGVAPRTRFVDGARATLAWYRAQGYLPGSVVSRRAERRSRVNSRASPW